MYKTNVLLEKTQLAFVDASVVFTCAVTATWLRHDLGLLSGARGGAVPWAEYLFPSLLVALAYVVLFRYQGLYAGPHGRLAEVFRVSRAAGIATLAVVAVTFFYRGYSYSRATVLIFCPLSILAVIAARNLYRVYRDAVMSHRSAARRVVIVGFGSVGQHLARSLLDNPSYYELVGFLDDSPLKAEGSLEGIRVLGTTNDLDSVIATHYVDEVILAIPSAPLPRITSLVGECLRLKVRWKLVPNLCDLMLDRVHIDQVGGLPLVGLRGSSIVGFNWLIKRLFDVAFSLLVLTLNLPLFVLIALAVKLTSRGPVLFRQERVGLNGRTFTFLKFRSMRVDHGTQVHEKYATDWIFDRTGGKPLPAVGAAAAEVARAVPTTHKMTNDPRITAVGNFLRKTSLDELPQFWNVLRGDMSIVGPRPPIPYEVENYTEWHKRRLEVLPGISGLWQVSGRNALSFDQMVRLDLEYIENWSLEEDIRIILKTIPAMLSAKAY